LLLSCSEPILRASHHEFKAFKEWILGTLKEIKPSKPIHPSAISLLEQFAYFCPEEIPSGLPPK